MNINGKYELNPKTGFLAFSLLLFLSISLSCCKSNDDDEYVSTPPDPNVETEILSYYPDSGGVATNLILHGTNFGTDLSYLKVYVNEKEAAIIGCDGEAIYAIVPSRADSGSVKVVVGKAPNVKEFIYPIQFKYFFKENVTTVCGQNGIKGIEDGDATTATLQRTWHISFDDDGTLFFIDEGRGVNAAAGLRKYINGNVETIMRNTSGIMQSPTALAFNIAQDTMYMLQSLWNENGMTSDVAIAYLTREEGFSVIRPLVRTTSSFNATGIAVHPINGDVFFNSRVDGYIYKANKETGAYNKVCQINGSDTELRMLFDPQGEYLYLMVKNKHCIYRAKYNNTTREVEDPELFAGQWNANGYKDGVGVTAQFDDPGQGTFDEDGNLYVPDRDNHSIRKITPEGVVTTFAGVPGESGYKDGDPLESMFNQPDCVTYNPVDRGWYVADRDNSVIRKILVE